MSVTGTWINVYDSKMQLTQDPDTGLITGTYSSTTGSTGTYSVLGYATSKSPTTDAGEALGLAIFWRSINSGDPEDNSWHWVSGLGGQAVSGTSSPILNLNHCMVATIPLGAIAAGNYLDKLIYNNTMIAEGSGSGSASANMAAPAIKQAFAPVASPINGLWTCQQNNQIQLNISLTDATTGVVTGTMAIGNGASTLAGFADPYAQGDNLAVQAVSVVAIASGLNEVISMSGSLNFSTGILTLVEFINQPTAQNSTWLQTIFSELTFTKS